ncbi:MAG: hypothetical protein AAF682_12450 [Planctomycetota bacterium]
MRARLPLLVVPLLLGSGLPSCGAVIYRYQWARFELDGEARGMEGRWRGDWRSEWNGHSGGLRCMLTEQAPGAYGAYFYSTFALVLFFRHETVFYVIEEEGGVLRFEGSQDLGQGFGGVYTYRGTVEGDLFRATYGAENGDHGVFEMRRVEG